MVSGLLIAYQLCQTLIVSKEERWRRSINSISLQYLKRKVREPRESDAQVKVAYLILVTRDLFIEPLTDNVILTRDQGSPNRLDPSLMQTFLDGQGFTERGPGFSGHSGMQSCMH